MAGKDFAWAAVLLAAGESSRMGEAKQLLPWLGIPLVVYQVSQLLLAGAETVVVVLGQDKDRVAGALHGFTSVTLAFNSSYRQGKSTSIHAGVAALPAQVDAILLHAVDQPRRGETLARLVAAHRAGGASITVPTYQGRRGHPPVLADSLRPDLLGVSEEKEGLREVVRRYRAETLEYPMDSAEVLLNINTPEDYRQALDYFRSLAP